MDRRVVGGAALAETQIASHLSVPRELLLLWSSVRFQILRDLQPGAVIRAASVVTCLATSDLIVLYEGSKLPS